MDDIAPKGFAGGLSRGMRGINFQLVLVLSLAVFPIGFISVVQSLGFVRETRRAAETLLLSLTRESATLEHRLIETGLHTYPLLVDVVGKNPANRRECSSKMKDFIAGQSIFRSVRFVSMDGASPCSSDGITLDMSGDATFQQFRSNPVPAVDRYDVDMNSATPVLKITQPVRENGNLIGYLSFVVPSIQLLHVPGESGVPAPDEVVVFNSNGTVLVSTLDLTDVNERLPEKPLLASLLNGADGVFEGTNLSGKRSSFVRVTLIKGMALAIGIWPLDNPISRTNDEFWNALTFPLLMWIVSLTSALFAARRLVVRPIQLLRTEMRRFALGQRNAPIVLPPGAALEIQETVATFGKLELIVARNESALAVTAEGKLLLLREVHHRIKNNLQMISSIISIQRRKTRDEDVILVLRSLQDRVLSIAAVDQSLYLNADVQDVRADTLVASITDRLIGVNLESGHSIQVTVQFDAVLLHPDQIGPLSLLANEAVTNALKYVGKPDGKPAFVDIQLKWEEDVIHFVVSNSTGPGPRDIADDRGSTGLGMSLIRAFCDQLAADCQSGLDADNHIFCLSVRFLPSGTKIVQNPPGLAVA